MGRLPRREGGYTVIELSIAAALTALTLTIVSGFLVSAQRTVSVEQVRSSTNDELRAAMEQLDREVRSTSFVLTLDPYTLLVQSQNNAPSPDNCVLWKLEDRELRRWHWPVQTSAAIDEYRVIADHIVNEELGQALFQLPDTPSNRLDTGGFTVDVVIHANTDYDADPDTTVALRQSLTGRNVEGDFVAVGLSWPPTTLPSKCQTLPS